MNATATPGSVPAPVTGNDAIQPPDNKEEPPAEPVKGVFIKRISPPRHICCAPGTRHPQENNKSVAHYEISDHKASNTIATPLQAPLVQETPGLPTFMEWLRQNHTETLYNCLADQLVNNPTCFTEARGQLPDPENQQSVFEAVALQLLRGQ